MAGKYRSTLKRKTRVAICLRMPQAVVEQVDTLAQALGLSREEAPSGRSWPRWPGPRSSRAWCV